MDYDEDDQKTIKTVNIGPEGEEQLLLLHCGTFLVEWTPERFFIPPQNLEGKARDDWYVERAKYRWTPIGKPDKNGAIRFRCPQCDGRVKTNAKTRISSKRSQRKAPYVATIDQEHCCKGTLTIPVRKTRHLPAHSLRHSRLEKELRPTPANREPQQPRQKRRRPQRRLVPGTRQSRLQLRTPRSANRSQPTPTQQLRPRQRKTRQRTATHPHHQPTAPPSHPIAPTGSKPETHPHNTPRDPTPTATNPAVGFNAPRKQKPHPRQPPKRPLASPQHHPKQPKPTKPTKKRENCLSAS